MLPSSAVEDYLKAIYIGTTALTPPTAGADGHLSSALGVVPGTATTMVKALAESGLVEYEPYAGVALTPAGPETGCSCSSADPLFNRQVVPLFSDLLLHDVGTGDGIVQANGAENEIRTPALWGLRLCRPLLHDGSAATIDETIRRHAAEADLARRGFDNLTGPDREALLALVRSL